MFKSTNNFGYFQIFWILEFRGQDCRNTSTLFFPLSICRVTSAFPSKLKTFLLVVTVVMLPSYQSPVNFRSPNAEGSFIHTVNYYYLLTLTYILIYLPTYLLHGAESFLRS